MKPLLITAKIILLTAFFTFPRISPANPNNIIQIAQNPKCDQLAGRYKQLSSWINEYLKTHYGISTTYVRWFQERQQIQKQMADLNCSVDPDHPYNINRRELLEAHNKYRRSVGVPPLEWSDDLEQSAQKWANQVANRHKDGTDITMKDHSRGGENISQGFLTDSLTQMVDGWGSEKQKFRNTVFDAKEKGSAISTTGNWQNVGHYTQIVWRNTQKVGCGLAKTNQYQFLVCHYAPPGNLPGQKAY